MSPNWRSTLSARFYYTKELLLGVALWQPEPKTQVIYRAPSAPILKRLSIKLAAIAFLASLVLLTIGVMFVPQAYYSFFPASIIKIQPDVLGAPLGSASDSTSATNSAQVQTLPPQDFSLPEGEWVLIDQIGVKAPVLATDEADEALKTGVWRSPEFGKPGDPGLPIILAAHRFGWDWWWQSDFGRLNSFYRLPETNPGTIVTLIADQRAWRYEIFAGEEGEEISRYDADLILYTCKHLSSPVRHFRYARLVP